MEILEFVEKNVRKRSWWYYIWVSISVLIAIYIIMEIVVFGEITAVGKGLKPAGQEIRFLEQCTKLDVKLWCFLQVCSLLGIIYIWFYYAPIFYEELVGVENLFKGKDYRQLCNSHKHWIRQFNCRGNRKETAVKSIYGVMWFVFIVVFIFYSYDYLSNVFEEKIVVAAVEILIYASALLNFSSYYNCVSFVYFVMKVFKLAKDDKLNYVKEIPSTTYGYQELKRTADTIYLYFLIDSSLCTVAYLSFWCIVYPHIYKTFTPAWS